MPYYDQLPPLPAFPQDAPGQLIKQELLRLRRQNSLWLSRGYDIVPNFYTSRFDWVRTADVATPTTILR